MSLRRVPAGAEREEYVPLLLLADESEQQVRSYLNQGELYDCRDDDRLIGVVLSVQHDTNGVELRAVAVEPAVQGQGLGRRMLMDVLDDLRSPVVSRVSENRARLFQRGARISTRPAGERYSGA